MVLFFSGLSFAGHVMRRLVGSGHGYLVLGLLGGVVSSTNVTFTFARTSRLEPVADRALALAANAMLYPRVLLATAVLNPVVIGPLLLYLHTMSPDVAATAIAIGVLANTVMKLGLALFLGSRRFQLITGGALALMLAAITSAIAYRVS